MIRAAEGSAHPQREWAMARAAQARDLTPASPRNVAAVMVGVMTLTLVGGALATLL